jgi:hypothetical protein
MTLNLGFPPSVAMFVGAPDKLKVTQISLKRCGEAWCTTSPTDTFPGNIVTRYGHHPLSPDDIRKKWWLLERFSSLHST